MNWSTNFKGLRIFVEMTASSLKHNLRSFRGHCLLLFASGYAAEIWQGQVYLQEALDHPL